MSTRLSVLGVPQSSTSLKAIVAVSVVTAAFSIPAPVIICKSNVYPVTCSAVYSINAPIIICKSNAYPIPCTAIYSVNNPIVTGICKVYPISCISIYSIPTPTVKAGEEDFATPCIAHYSINAPIIICKSNAYPIPCTAIYSVNSPDINKIVVYPNASSMEFYVSSYYQVHAGGIPNYKDISKMPTIWLRKCNGQNYDNERKLYRKLVTEAYNKFGVCMTYYILSYDTTYDKIRGEDNDRKFTRKFDIMAYFPLQTEEKTWNKFTVQGLDNFSVFVSKDHYRSACTYGNTLAPGNRGRNTYPVYVPKTGDILQSKFNKYLYELVTVKEESMMIHLSKRYVWEFIIKPYIDEHHTFDDAAGTSLDNIKPFVDATDILKVNAEAQVAAANVDYVPRSCEYPPRDPNSGW